MITLARRLLSVGKFLFARTAALISAFLLAGAVVARFGDAELGAYQISFQLWIFLALVLDAIAIAGQIIVGRELGASRPERAYDASVRMIASLSRPAGCSRSGCSRSDVLPRLFTSDPEVLAQCALLWPIFALMQPLNGAVFALDGILIGASDGPYIAASMVAAFAACAAALAAVWTGDWGCRSGRPRGADPGCGSGRLRPVLAAAAGSYRLGIERGVGGPAAGQAPIHNLRDDGLNVLGGDSRGAASIR